MTPNPFVKQYLMTAGPTPVPPAGLAGDGGADALPPRARVRGDLRAGARQAARRLPDVQRRPLLQRERVGRRWTPPPRTSCARARRCSPAPRASSASAGSSSATPTAAETVRYEPGWGERLDPAEIDRLLDEQRRDRGRLRHAQRDLDRHRPRRPGDRRGRQAPRRDPRRRRRLRPRRGRAAPGRVGHRRRRRRLPEGADVPARPRLRVGQPARARLRGRAARRPLLLRLGQDREEPAQGRQPVHAGRRRCSWASTSRST